MCFSSLCQDIFEFDKLTSSLLLSKASSTVGVSKEVLSYIYYHTNCLLCIRRYMSGRISIALVIPFFFL